MPPGHNKTLDNGYISMCIILLRLQMLIAFGWNTLLVCQSFGIKCEYNIEIKKNAHTFSHIKDIISDKRLFITMEAFSFLCVNHLVYFIEIKKTVSHIKDL